MAKKMNLNPGTVLAAVVASSGLFFGWVLYRVVFFLQSDYNTHLPFLEEAEKAGNIFSVKFPHLLFFILTHVAHWVMPSTLVSAYAVVLCFYVFLAVVLFRYFDGLGGSKPPARFRIFAFFSTFGLMLVTPITMFTWGEDNHYLGYLGINVYHNPTMPLLKPLAVLVFLRASDLFVKGKANWRELTLTGFLAILSGLAKPSFLICLVPAMGAAWAYKIYRGQKTRWREMALGVIVPAVAVLVWQYSILADYYKAAGNEGDHLIFAPFLVMSHYSSFLFGKFIVSVAFPLGIAYFYRKRIVSDARFGLAALVFGASLGLVYLFAESGRSMRFGNLLWSGQIALLILFIESFRIFVTENLDFFKQGRLPRGEAGTSFYACATLFALHLVSGIAYLPFYLGGGVERSS